MSAEPEPRPVHFRELDPPTDAEADELSEFLRAQSPAGDGYPPEKLAYLRWKLTHNDVHGGFATLAVSSATDQCVSLCCVTPKRLWRGGREVLWAEIGDTFTDAGFQRRGLFVKVVDASRVRAQRAGFDLVFGLPNEQSRPGYVKKLDFAVKEDLTLVQHVLPLSTRPLAARGFVERRPALATALRSRPVNAAAARTIRAVLRGRTLRSDYRVAESAGFGPAYDDLWQRARRHLPNAQVRDARHLRWRFERNPFSFVVLEASRGGKLAGYLVMVLRESGGEHPFTHAIVVDWLYDLGLDDRGRLPRALLERAALFASRAGADLLSATSTPITPLPLPFPPAAFLRRPVDLPVILHQNGAGKELLAAREGFHFTLSDTDSF